MSTDLRGPSKPLLLLCFSILLLTCSFFWWQILPTFGIPRIDRNFYGFLSGAFFGVVALARFEYMDALRVRSRKSFEWSLITGRALARTITIVGWVLSLFHIYSWLRELTRG